MKGSLLRDASLRQPAGAQGGSAPSFLRVNPFNFPPFFFSFFFFFYLLHIQLILWL